MLHRTSAVSALKAGCRRLQLPDDTALELVRFLQTKRIHDQFVTTATKCCNMSPGAAVDKLWHFMLLNTDISTSVHELVGGVVRHVGTDEDDLDDDTKRMQRLYAMNVMAREGHQPDVRLWADPDTNMSFIYPVKQTDGSTLYICPDMSAAEQSQLRSHIARLYINSRSSTSTSSAAAAAALATAQPRSVVPGCYKSIPSNIQNDVDSESENDDDDDAADIDEPEPKRHKPYIAPITVVNLKDNSIYHISPSTLYSPPSMSVAWLKQLMAEQLSVPATQVLLMGEDYNSSSRKIGLVLLSEGARVSSGQVVRVVLPSVKLPRAPATPFELFIKTMTGKTINLTGKVAPWKLISQVKSAVQDHEGIPPDQQRLVYSGTLLEDEYRSLEQYKVPHGAVVHLVLKLRGC